MTDNKRQAAASSKSAAEQIAEGAEGDLALTGVVYRVRADSVSVAIKPDDAAARTGSLSFDPGASTTFMIFRLTDDITYVRASEHASIDRPRRARRY